MKPQFISTIVIINIIINIAIFIFTYSLLLLLTWLNEQDLDRFLNKINQILKTYNVKINKPKTSVTRYNKKKKKD